MASTCHMYNRQRNPHASRAPGFLLLSIDNHKVITQNNRLVDEIEHLSVQLHLCSFGKAQLLESLAKTNLIIGHKSIEEQSSYRRPQSTGCDDRHVHMVVEIT